MIRPSSLVLVCLSVDVTGALALPNSFCAGYLHMLHAPPPICPFCHLALLWSGVDCLSSAVSMLPSPLLSSFCVFALVPGGICVFLFCFGSVGSSSFSVLCAPLVSGAGSGFPVLPALPCCFLSLVVLPPLPCG